MYFSLMRWICSPMDLCLLLTHQPYGVKRLPPRGLKTGLQTVASWVLCILDATLTARALQCQHEHVNIVPMRFPCGVHCVASADIAGSADAARLFSFCLCSSSIAVSLIHAQTHQFLVTASIWRQLWTPQTLC